MDDWFSDEKATFGDRLAGAREAAGLSQEDLARKLGVKEKTIHAWEDDLSEPRANRLQMLAGLLNVSLMWLLTGKGEGVAPPEEVAPVPEDLDALLTDLRLMRAETGRMAERMGLMEKRLKRWTRGVAA
jgi:transcriptional regulator with XRE-family HTH domain